MIPPLLKVIILIAVFKSAVANPLNQNSTNVRQNRQDEGDGDSEEGDEAQSSDTQQVRQTQVASSILNPTFFGSIAGGDALGAIAAFPLFVPEVFKSLTSTGNFVNGVLNYTDTPTIPSFLTKHSAGLLGAFHALMHNNPFQNNMKELPPTLNQTEAPSYPLTSLTQRPLVFVQNVPAQNNQILIPNSEPTYPQPQPAQYERLEIIRENVSELKTGNAEKATTKLQKNPSLSQLYKLLI